MPLTPLGDIAAASPPVHRRVRFCTLRAGLSAHEGFPRTFESAGLCAGIRHYLRFELLFLFVMGASPSQDKGTLTASTPQSNGTMACRPQARMTTQGEQEGSVLGAAARKHTESFSENM